MNDNFSLFSNSEKKQEQFIMSERYPNFDEFEKIQKQFIAELEQPLFGKKRVERQSELASRMCRAFESILADPNVRLTVNELFLLLYGDFIKIYKYHFQSRSKSVKARKKTSLLYKERRLVMSTLRHKMNTKSVSVMSAMILQISYFQQSF